MSCPACLLNACQYSLQRSRHSLAYIQQIIKGLLRLGLCLAYAICHHWAFRASSVTFEFIIECLGNSTSLLLFAWNSYYVIWAIWKFENCRTQSLEGLLITDGRRHADLPVETSNEAIAEVLAEKFFPPRGGRGPWGYDGR